MPATEQIRRGGRTVPAAEENLLKWSDVQNVLRLDRNGFRGRDIARIADADEAFNRRSCLPVWKSGENVVKTLQESDIVVVSAATGSGKSTQIPQIRKALDVASQQDLKRVAIVVPTKIGVYTLAKQLAEEIGCEVGEEVAWRTGEGDNQTIKAKFVIMPPASLLNMAAKPGGLEEFDTIILDEAHILSLEIEVILRYMRYELAVTREYNFQLILMSATLRSADFSEYFNLAGYKLNELVIDGRRYSLEISYMAKNPTDVYEAARDLVCVLMGSTVVGDIIVFVPGAREAEISARSMEDAIGKAPLGTVGRAAIHTVYGEKLQEEKNQVLAADRPPDTAKSGGMTLPGRKIYVGTDVLATSVTIAGVTVIIDLGLVKRPRQLRGINAGSLSVVQDTQAEADQKAGRAGRTGPGRAYRLYTLETYHKKLPYPKSALETENLLPAVASSMILGLPILHAELPWTKEPDDMPLAQAINDLISLKIIDYESEELTPAGRTILSIPTDIYNAKMLFEAIEFGMVYWFLHLAALQEAGKVFKSSPNQDQAQQIAQAHIRNSNDIGGDHQRLMTIYEDFIKQPASSRNAWAERFDLNPDVLNSAVRIRARLARRMEEVAPGCTSREVNHVAGIGYRQVVVKRDIYGDRFQQDLRRVLIRGLLLSAFSYHHDVYKRDRDSVLYKPDPISSYHKRTQDRYAFPEHVVASDVILFDPENDDPNDAKPGRISTLTSITWGMLIAEGNGYYSQAGLIDDADGAYAERGRRI